jgi:hypothetical protein
VGRRGMIDETDRREMMGVDLCGRLIDAAEREYG